MMLINSFKLSPWASVTQQIDSNNVLKMWIIIWAKNIRFYISTNKISNHYQKGIKVLGFDAHEIKRNLKSYRKIMHHQFHLTQLLSKKELDNKGIYVYSWSNILNRCGKGSGHNYLVSQWNLEYQIDKTNIPFYITPYITITLSDLDEVHKLVKRLRQI